MTLPLHLQMEIDIHAQLHQKEIAEGFAKLRAKLPPERTLTMAMLQAALMNAASIPMAQRMMLDMMPSQQQPLLPSWYFQNSFPQILGGLFGSTNNSAW